MKFLDFLGELRRDHLIQMSVEIARKLTDLYVKVLRFSKSAIQIQLLTVHFKKHENLIQKEGQN